MGGGVFCKKVENGGGRFFAKKVDLSSTQGAFSYTVSVFFFTFYLLGGCVRTPPALRAWLSTHFPSLCLLQGGVEATGADERRHVPDVPKPRSDAQALHARRRAAAC